MVTIGNRASVTTIQTLSVPGCYGTPDGGDPYKRDSIILGTSDDIFLEIWDCLNIVKNLNTCQLSCVYWHGVVSRA